MRDKAARLEENTDVLPVMDTPSDPQHQNHAHQAPLFYDQPLRLDDPTQFPPWVKEYVEWHAQMRKQFPGMELFTNPKAPKLLIRTCLGLCGGLHDRVGQLPWDLYLAQATNRVLLMAWQRPRSLENFLIPNHPDLFDWRVPPQAKFGFDDMKHVRNYTQLFEGFLEDRPTEEFWKDHIDLALERATTGSFKDVHVLRLRILGHLGEAALEARLQQDFPQYAPSSNYHQVHVSPYFGNLFWLFFRPSPAIQELIQTNLQTLELVPQQYHAVHCRVRHPKATSASVMVKGKNPKYTADKTGLPWEGETKEFALQVASQALGCSLQIQDDASPVATTPVYFLSDSNDLVHHVVFELQDPTFRQNYQQNWTEMDRQLDQVVHYPPNSATINHRWIKARDVSEETAHLDKQKGRPPEAYYNTFVDLVLAIHARCVVYGIGYYAAFAAKISGTTCQYLYQQEAWGSQAIKQAKICPSTLLASPVSK